MALDNKIKRVEYISVERLLTQPVSDPDYVSVADYVKTILAGGTFASDKITPPVLINMLERDCKEAIELVKNISTSNNNTLMFEVADVKAWPTWGYTLLKKSKEPSPCKPIG